MNRERKIKSFLVRFLMAGGICLIFSFMKLLPVCDKIVAEIFQYVVSDVVFFHGMW